ncbi:MAG: hypothetical protein RQ733_06365 [Methyloprofundus sp.]|nr:hypothetical protein [Methyloprofundus sp.]
MAITILICCWAYEIHNKKIKRRFYIEYDVQQKGRAEVVKNFSLDINKYHSSEQLLRISQSLKKLTNQIEARYKLELPITLAETQDKQDIDYVKKVNRSCREVFKKVVGSLAFLPKCGWIF